MVMVGYIYINMVYTNNRSMDIICDILLYVYIIYYMYACMYYNRHKNTLTLTVTASHSLTSHTG
jgi:hypothetical protein